MVLVCRKNGYSVQCTGYEEDDWELGVMCAMGRCLFEPPFEGETIRPHTSADVKGYCPKHYTAEQAYAKIKALEKKTVSEFKKDIYSIDNFEKTVRVE